MALPVCRQTLEASTIVLVRRLEIAIATFRANLANLGVVVGAGVEVEALI